MNSYYIIQCLNKKKIALSSQPFVCTVDTDDRFLYQLLSDLNFSLISRRNKELKFRIIKVSNVPKSTVFSFCVSKFKNNYLEKYDEENIKTYEPFTFIVDNLEANEVTSSFKINDDDINVRFNVFRYPNKNRTRNNNISNNNENDLDKIYLCNPSFKI